MRLSRRYALLCALLLLTEVLIALYLHDPFVRPYVGDSLAVVTLYCLVLTFFELPRQAALLGVFVFACCLEGAQYLRLVEVLGVQDNRVLSVIIGTVFSPFDLVAYAAGALLAALLERSLGTPLTRAPDLPG